MAVSFFKYPNFIQNYVSLVMEKLMVEKNAKSEDSSIYSGSGPLHCHRSSYPELPISLKEKEVVLDTDFQQIVPLDTSPLVKHNTCVHRPRLTHSQSSDSVLDGNINFYQATPPPKPPFPGRFVYTLAFFGTYIFKIILGQCKTRGNIMSHF